MTTSTENSISYQREDKPRYSAIHIENSNERINEPVSTRTRDLTLGAMLFVAFATIASVVFKSQGGIDLANSNAQVLQVESASSGEEKHVDPAYYYKHQLVDHFDPDNKKTWTQKYYKSDKYWGGPGHPIFLVVGGEGPATRLLYPFINEMLGKKFKSFVLQPELRFYGESQPVEVKKNTDMVGLLKTEQALADKIQLLEYTKKKLGCSPHKSSKHYCPVISVGGSYPGFMSALLRLAYPDHIDISYASSAPLHLYAQNVNPDDYFELVTRTAEQASGGCSTAVRNTLEAVHASITESASFLDEAKEMNICLDHIPDYIDSKELFAEELMAMVAAHFADYNMDFYPPTAESSLARACFIFQDDSLDNYGKIDSFLQLVDAEDENDRKGCGFDMRSQIPAGANATISTSDWTGAGDGPTALSWEFQCCTELVVQTSLSQRSMFWPRKWTLEWLTEHCQSRFGMTPQPTYLLEKFGFDDLTNASRILFTNGLNDGWSASSILDPINPSVITINFPNGAHHSDLSHESNFDADTEDIKLGHKMIGDQIELWLEEIKAENKHKH